MDNASPLKDPQPTSRLPKLMLGGCTSVVVAVILLLAVIGAIAIYFVGKVLWIAAGTQG